MSEIKLQNRHLFISGALAADAFGDVIQVYVVYYAQNHALLLAPIDDPLFPTMHKARMQMLKTRNLQGDRSISMEEILIDHDIDDTDRDLPYNYQPGLRMVHINL